jgi:lipoprotein-anchoring transpeptidase ErfK/SrfK
MGFVRVLAATAATVLLISSMPVAARMKLAATEPVDAAAQSNKEEPANQTTDVAITAPIESEMAPLVGQEISDAALPVASIEEMPQEMVEAEPLERPEPTLFADIDLAKQRMTVSDAKGVIDSWKISSARGGYETPTGTYTVNWTSRMHYSKQYHNSPMPYSVFFNRGVAVHGTNAVSRLGRPASHGCVRSHTRNAKKFYNLVQKHGEKLTKIVVHGTPPYTPVVRERPRRRYREPSSQPFFFAAQPPSYQRQKRRRRYGGGGSYYGGW